MLSEEQLKAAYNGCKEGGHLGALAAVAEAAVKDAVGVDGYAHHVLGRIAEYPKSRSDELSADHMRAIARDALSVHKSDPCKACEMPQCRDAGSCQHPSARPQASAAVPEGTAEVLSDLLCLIDNNLKFGCVPMAYIRAKALYRFLAASQPEVK